MNTKIDKLVDSIALTKEDINVAETRDAIVKKVSKLISDMCLRWRENFSTVPPVDFIEPTANIIVGEVICYQLTKELKKMEDDKC